ncbi:MAG: methyltransferase domain-containing protein [Bdellovibrionales bacterium]|nr:methyltransferase domain-containing protein [Bdellovibrionales bacterium]
MEIINSKYAGIDELLVGICGNTPRIDLGCGIYKPKGFVGLDNFVGLAAQVEGRGEPPDITLNLNAEPLPFKDSSIQLVRASHFLEHSLVDHILTETNRVLTSDGRFEIIIPYANSAEGMYPGHTIFFTERWFEESPVYQRLFKTESVTYKESDIYTKAPFWFKTLFPFEVGRKFLFNACNEMKLVCSPRKN